MQDQPSKAKNTIIERLIHLLRPLIYVGVVVAFAADITQEIFYVPFGLLYIPLVCTAVFHQNPRSTWWLAALASFLVLIGFFLPIITPDPTNGIMIRSLSVAAIFITAALVRHARDIQDRLTAQTRRAENAERVKTDVFTTLSEEMRSPLQTMVGLSEVMIAGCRPDQRAPLLQVQAGSKRLLAAMENLIDLTQMNDCPLLTERLDVNRAVRQAVEANQSLAAERQISVAVDLSELALTARGDPWAVRRILDNLISNAVKYTPAGGIVELATEAAVGSVSLLVRDTGVGMSADTIRRLDEPTGGIGTGLTLSRRLAGAMGAELAFDSELGGGTTAILRLQSA